MLIALGESLTHLYCHSTRESLAWKPSKTCLRPHKKILVSRPLKIEKKMRACDFCFFLSFLQGQIEIFETGLILHFSHIMKNVFLS